MIDKSLNRLTCQALPIITIAFFFRELIDNFGESVIHDST